jgi:hypothetical protein
MKKFNNTLAGTDCGDAGLPAHRCGIAKAKPVLRVVARTARRKDAALDLMVHARGILNVDEDGVECAGGELLRRGRVPHP